MTEYRRLMAIKINKIINNQYYSDILVPRVYNDIQNNIFSFLAHDLTDIFRLRREIKNLGKGKVLLKLRQRKNNKIRYRENKLEDDGNIEYEHIIRESRLKFNGPVTIKYFGFLKGFTVHTRDPETQEIYFYDKRRKHAPDKKKAFKRIPTMIYSHDCMGDNMISWG